MQQDTDNAAAEAFEGVRAEIALLRRAVERLAAEKAELEIPDYSETLGHTDRAVTVLAQRVDLLAKSAALSLTPETIGQQITKAASTVRTEDQRTIVAARAGLEQATSRLDGFVASARREGRQNRWLAWTALAGVFLGMLLWAVFAGVAARAAPERWRWPERIAARTMRLPGWEAGKRLMVTDSPTSFNSILLANRLVTANRDAIGACRKAAKKKGDAVRCTVRVGAVP